MITIQRQIKLIRGLDAEEYSSGLIACRLTLPKEKKNSSVSTRDYKHYSFRFKGGFPLIEEG